MSSAQVGVFLLCENRLLHEALLRILGKRDNLKVLGACAYSPAALTELTALRPEVLLLDSHAFLHQAQCSVQNVRTLMVGMERNEESFLHAVREGVAGYIVRDASAAEVVAIRAVAAGEAVCPACFSSALFRCAAHQLAVQQNLQRRNHAELSRREQQLVELVCWGLTNKEIASRLSLSEHTVKNHIHRILRRTGAKDRISLMDRYHSRMATTEVNSPTLTAAEGF